MIKKLLAPLAAIIIVTAMAAATKLTDIAALVDYTTHKNTRANAVIHAAKQEAKANSKTMVCFIQTMDTSDPGRVVDVRVVTCTSDRIKPNLVIVWPGVTPDE